MQNTIKYKGIEYKSGDSILFKMDDVKVIRGKLYIKPRETYNYKNYTYGYLCHNDRNYDGSNSPDMLGYKYSWSFTIDIRDKDIFECSDVKILCHDIDVEDKENFKITKKLKLYLETQELEIVSSFLQRGTIFKQYNKFEMSEKSGYIKLTNTTSKRFVDIKFGRFLTSLFKEIKETYGIDLGFNNKDIERFYNCFVAYQNNTCTEVLEVKGEDILEGYKLENYLLEKSTLGGSCMTDKLDNIKLYTLNPNIVSLLVIKTFGKIVGRCLIWNTDQGKIMDKQYTCFDWVNSKFDQIKKKNGYICFSSLEDYPTCKKIDIKLDNIDVDKYPYIDTFRFMNREKGFITNCINSNMYEKNTEEQNKEFIQLTRTEGNYYYFDHKGHQQCSEDLDDDVDIEEDTEETLVLEY